MTMGSVSQRSVWVDGAEIIYHLEQKSVKNLNLRIRNDGSIYVSAHPFVALAEVDAFVCKKSAYIRNAAKEFKEIEQFHQRPKKYVSGETFYLQGHGLRLKVAKADKDAVSDDGVYIFLNVADPADTTKKQRLVTRYLDKQCRVVFSEILCDIYPVFRKYGVPMPKLRIRNMETRWGSCLSEKGIITLNKRLIEAPRNGIEYVIMHEMCHFIHPNHSRQFYTFLTMLMPDWKERKRALDQCAVYWL